VQAYLEEKRRRNLLWGVAAGVIAGMVLCAWVLYGLVGAIGEHFDEETTERAEVLDEDAKSEADVSAAEEPEPAEVEEPAEEEPEEPAVADVDPSPSPPRSPKPRFVEAAPAPIQSSSDFNFDIADMNGGEDDAMLDASLDEPDEVGQIASELSSLDRFHSSAAEGRLTSSQILELETLDRADPGYTRSRALLFLNAQRRGNARSANRYLDEIMALPENQYNPVWLTAVARQHVNDQRYQMALDRAKEAERYWQRIPSEIMFAKKAEIFEIQAASYQGLFYNSEDVELLDKAVRHWEKYGEHVNNRGRSDLARKAYDEVEKLQGIRGRL
jgi:tetratricopeptide (TPR) repeat protein